MEVQNPYVCVEISESQFQTIKDSLKKELVKLGFEDIQELPNPHISIAYILGKKNVDQLEQLADEISEGSFKMAVNGIKAVDAPYYKGTIISLSLIHTDDFLYSQEFVKDFITDDDVLIKEYFPGGFQAHLSLFLLKGLPQDLIDVLPEYLEIAVGNVKADIQGESFSIHNGDREKIIGRKFLG